MTTTKTTRARPSRSADTATLVWTCLLLAACAGSPTARPSAHVAAPAPLPDVAAINASLGSLTGTGAGPLDYRVGAGDLLEISVFQLEELDRQVRVRHDGNISLPLLGTLRADRMTTTEIEDLLAARLAENTLRNPQVSVLVTEYRSQPVAVHGAVNEPGIYYLREPRTLVEMLSEAGGLSEDAGLIVQLRRPGSSEAGDGGFRQISVDLQQLLAGGDPLLNRSLRGGDRVHVPTAGIVYVEGAVKKPGAYAMRGPTNVLKAISIAGGVEFSARGSDIQVVRGSHDGIQVVSLDRIRRDPKHDVALRDGDVVVVHTSTAKLVLAGIGQALARMITLGAGL